MTKEVTIAGHVFQVQSPYEEGHVCTAGEAAALNQTFHENIRNNTAKAVKEAVEKGEDPAPIVAKYADEYAFGVRSSAGPRAPKDPVAAEALNLAKAKVREALKAKNQKATKEQIAELAATLAQREDYIEKARAIVAAKQSATASLSLEDLGIAA